MSKISTGVFAALLLLFSAGCGDSISTSSNPDQAFVTDVALGGMTEVKLGEIAQKNGTGKAVKDFGARMIADHGKANSELSDLAAKKHWDMLSCVGFKTSKGYGQIWCKLTGLDFDKEYINTQWWITTRTI